MPTARPIITASSGDALDTVTNLEAAMSAPAEAATPTSAPMSGRPAASIDPNVSTSTRPANSTPNASVTVTP
ncbi:hypothetical protein BC477_19520 [Clavibacter michiganensis subsp. michiganensis]|uniref:Uncharacterized protein n=1 Tax=Clavibacter michiganensis subsp. michiganensis TaxID=33013 RepID=A0A251XHC6_CLAMM|nr:hypothetical protein BC477_19520 [Clavibacter michiganensis subsp. michiganensis]OUE01674.1 hypothetical protein CMMCAS07_15305 [Clavibacter michiganensis subsp. michiganensis]